MMLTRFEIAILYFVIMQSSACIFYMVKFPLGEEDSRFQRAIYYIAGPLSLPWLIIQPWICTFGIVGETVSVFTISIYNMILLYRTAEIMRRKVRKLEADGSKDSVQYRMEKARYDWQRVLQWIVPLSILGFIAVIVL